MIQVEVVYALPERQVVVALELPEGSTVLEAARRSGIAEQEGLDLATHSLGIFGRIEKNPAEELLRDGDRVEIYRPLLIDPKEARKARAAKVKAEKTKTAR